MKQATNKVTLSNSKLECFHNIFLPPNDATKAEWERYKAWNGPIGGRGTDGGPSKIIEKEYEYDHGWARLTHKNFLGGYCVSCEMHDFIRELQSRAPHMEIDVIPTMDYGLNVAAKVSHSNGFSEAYGNQVKEFDTVGLRYKDSPIYHAVVWFNNINRNSEAERNDYYGAYGDNSYVVTSPFLRRSRRLRLFEGNANECDLYNTASVKSQSVEVAVTKALSIGGISEPTFILELFKKQCVLLNPEMVEDVATVYEREHRDLRNTHPLRHRGSSDTLAKIDEICEVVAHTIQTLQAGNVPSLDYYQKYVDMLDEHNEKVEELRERMRDTQDLRGLHLFKLKNSDKIHLLTHTRKTWMAGTKHNYGIGVPDDIYDVEYMTAIDDINKLNVGILNKVATLESHLNSAENASSHNHLMGMPFLRGIGLVGKPDRVIRSRYTPVYHKQVVPATVDKHVVVFISVSEWLELRDL